MSKISTSNQRPTSWQTRRTRAVTEWYLENHFQKPGDPGLVSMFSDQGYVGAFAIDADALALGDDEALFRLLVTTTMFQRRQDLQIMRILVGIADDDALEMTTQQVLLDHAEGSGCPHISSNQSLLDGCDLGKDSVTKEGICGAQPNRTCRLKRHTELLKRYGHFGKVPSSIALAVHEYGGAGLSALRERVLNESEGLEEATRGLEVALSSAWRVSLKISNMFLSLITNPAFMTTPPWIEGVDWTHYVVIDSNVDLFLKEIGYPGPWTYERRRSFIRDLARRIDLSDFDPSLDAYNPRLVQQAMFLFMSESNRRGLARDCSHLGACAVCDGVLRKICPRVQTQTGGVA